MTGGQCGRSKMKTMMAIIREEKWRKNLCSFPGEGRVCWRFFCLFGITEDDDVVLTHSGEILPEIYFPFHNHLYVPTTYDS